MRIAQLYLLRAVADDKDLANRGGKRWGDL
jgi:hypothetical protein